MQLPWAGSFIETKKNAIHLYLEGMGIRAIARFLKVSNVAVLKWIRKAGEIIQSMHSKTLKHETEAQIIEMDELPHYVQKKGVNYGFGWLLTEFESKLLPFKLVVEESKRARVFITK
jgi:transposase